jgi:hypothetical protein
MKYLIKLDERAAVLVREGLGKLPHDSVRWLIEDVGTQMAQQEKQASLPPVEAVPGQGEHQ